ncbi:MAG TPA: FtsX-like permease family protein [Candidatus Saccharimonadales bacterium]|nr:FtsX-like permease family protein [Candidatus Saccharimonadales bacterium]
MSAQPTNNRRMFWRIVRRLLSANRGRLFVVLLALGSGATITAALLNLQVDAKRRLTREFRAFGPNLVVAPSSSSATEAARTIPESTFEHFPAQQDAKELRRAGFLYTIAQVTPYPDRTTAEHTAAKAVVIAGLRYDGTDGLDKILPYKTIEAATSVVPGANTCQIGASVATEFGIHFNSLLQLDSGAQRVRCIVSEIRSFGGAEDNQIFVAVEHAQRLAGLPHELSLIQARVTGPPEQIDQYVSALQKALPEAEVRPIRQFTEAEGKIYSRISGLLTATVAIVLALTGLCVLAAMTNVAMERRNDVGLMKAIGGSVRRVVRFFLVEAALLGLIAGSFGAAAGIAISTVLGKAVFGVAAQPRLIVYPVAVALTIMVAILSSFPLRRLAGIRPALVFRGEA